MKLLLFATLLIIPVISFAQYIIISPDKAIKAKDISAASSARDLVIYEADVDSVVSILNKYKDLMKRNTKATFTFNEEKAVNSVIKVQPKRVSVVDRYAITIETTINGTTYKRELTDVNYTNGDNVKKLGQFINKIRQL